VRRDIPRAGSPSLDHRRAGAARIAERHHRALHTAIERACAAELDDDHAFVIVTRGTSIALPVLGTTGIEHQPEHRPANVERVGSTSIATQHSRWRGHVE